MTAKEGEAQKEVEVVVGKEGVNAQAASDANSKGASITTTALGVIRNTVGASILAQPQQIRDTGVILGLFLFFLFAAVASTTFYIIMACAARTKRTTYKQLLIEATGSQKAGTILECILIVYLCGILVAYARIVCDAMPSVATNFFGANGFVADQIFWLLCSSVVFFGLSVLRHLKMLRYYSYFGMCAVLYLMTSVMMRFFDGSYRRAGNTDLVDPNITWDASARFFVSIPVIAVAFSCHYNAPVFYQEMSNRSPRRCMYAYFLALPIMVIMYLTVGLPGYFTMGNDRVESSNGNVLKGYTSGDSIINVSRISFFVHILGCFPILCIAARRSINSALFQEPLQSDKIHVIEVTAIVTGCCLLAYLVPGIKTVLQLMGCICVYIIFVIPAFLYLRIFSKERLALEEPPQQKSEEEEETQGGERKSLLADIQARSPVKSVSVVDVSVKRNDFVYKACYGIIAVGIPLSFAALGVAIYQTATK